MCQSQERNEFLWRPGEEFKLWETEILKQFAKKKVKPENDQASRQHDQCS